VAETANVEILIEAMTSAAQEALDDVGDELTGLAADGEVTQEVLDELADELDEATTSGETTQAVVDEIGDELKYLSADAESAQAMLDELADELDDTSRSSAEAMELIEGLDDELTDMSADTTVAQDRLDELADELDDVSTSSLQTRRALLAIPAKRLAAAFQGLALSADDAEEEISEAGRSAAVTAGAFSTLSVAVGGLSFSFRTLSLALVASLIPALLTLSTVLLPLAALLGGVAAAAVGLGGVLGGLTIAAVVTNTEELTAALKEARAEIVEIIQPLGEVFGPLLLDAIRALPELVRRIIDSFGPLDQFAQTVRELGQTLFSVIPSVTGLLFDLAERALPVLVNVLNFFMDNGQAIIDATAEAFDRLGPPLRELGSTILDVLPSLFEIGLIVGELVIPALTSFFDALGTVGDLILDLDEDLRRLVIAALLTAPAILAATAALGSLLGPLGIVAGAVAAFASAYRSNFLGIRDATQEAVQPIIETIQGLRTDLQPFVDDLRRIGAQVAAGLTTAADAVISFASDFASAFAQLGGGEALAGLADAVIGLVQEIIDTVGALIDAIQPTADRVAEFLSAENFAAFAVVAINALTAVTNFLTETVIPIIRFVLLQFVIPLINRLSRVWAENFGDIARETGETMSALLSFIRPVLNVIAAAWEMFGDEILTATRFAFDIILGVIGTVMDAIATIILVALNLLQGDWKEAIRLIADFFVDAFLGLLEFVNDWGIIDAIKGVFQGIFQAAMDLIFRGLPELFVQTMATVMTIIENFGAAIHETLLAVFNGVIGLIASGINGLISDVESAINAILATIDTVADEVSEIPGVDNINPGRLEAATVDASRLQQERGQIVNQQDRQQNAQEIRSAIELTIQGAGPLADLLREEAEATVNDQKRRDDRKLRRQRPER